jgi:hypothetical protein
MNDPQLIQCLQLLRQDDVICSYRYSALFTFLDDQTSRARVAQTLQLLGRDVRQTSHSVAMYWRDLNGCLADYKKSISPSDIDLNRTALQECAAKLIEEIRFAIA